MKPKKQYKGTITEIKEIAKELYLLKIRIVIDIQINPGQFISIYCDNFTLRRPFSVMNFENNIISILFKKKGKGTEYISKLKIGDEIDFSGPFGNGFTIQNKKTLLIAGGVGIAPVYYLKRTLDKQHIANFLIAGFQNIHSIPKNIDIDMISTDDGSFGKKGFITDYTEEVISKFSPQIIYSCGPFILMKKINDIAKKHSIPFFVAMEKEMACSIGVCRGCVINLNNGQNATVCKDGPVFDSEVIKWE